MQQIADLDLQIFRQKFENFKSQLSSSDSSSSSEDEDDEDEKENHLKSEKQNPIHTNNSTSTAQQQQLSHGKTSIVEAFESCIEFSIESNIQMLMMAEDEDHQTEWRISPLNKTKIIEKRSINDFFCHSFVVCVFDL